MRLVLFGLLASACSYPQLPDLGDGAPSGPFAPGVNFKTAGDVAGIAVADFNGDHVPDLAVASGIGKVSVLFNTTPVGAKTPAFADSVDFTTDDDSRNVAIADFNKDDKPDLAVTNVIGDSISVLLDTGAIGATSPTFSARATLSTTDLPTAAVGDINGDGKPDVVYSVGETISVRLDTTPIGAFSPTFAPNVDMASGRFCFAIAVADLDHDGRPDLVCGASDAAIAVFQNTTVVGSTNPTFGPEITIPTGVAGFSLVLADLNGDGNLDLVRTTDNAVTVVLHGATASSLTFSLAAEFPAGVNTRDVAVGDLDGDGKPDLVVVNADDKTISILYNTTPNGAATPTFAPKLDLAAGDAPNAVAIVDVNGDGKQDLVIGSGSFGDPGVSVLLAQ